MAQRGLKKVGLVAVVFMDEAGNSTWAEGLVVNGKIETSGLVEDVLDEIRLEMDACSGGIVDGAVVGAFGDLLDKRLVIGPLALWDMYAAIEQNLLGVVDKISCQPVPQVLGRHVAYPAHNRCSPSVDICLAAHYGQVACSHSRFYYELGMGSCKGGYCSFIIKSDCDHRNISFETAGRFL